MSRVKWSGSESTVGEGKREGRGGEGRGEGGEGRGKGGVLHILPLEPVACAQIACTTGQDTATQGQPNHRREAASLGRAPTCWPLG